MASNWKPENLCRRCACNPCQCHTHEHKKAAGQEAYDERKKVSTPAPAKKKAPTKKRGKTKPKKSKASFIRKLRADNPSISDAQIKKALKKAGYSSCLVLAIVLASPLAGLVWGGIEIVRAVWG